MEKYNKSDIGWIMSYSRKMKEVAAVLDELAEKINDDAPDTVVESLMGTFVFKMMELQNLQK